MVPYGIVFGVLVQELGSESKYFDRVLSFGDLSTMKGEQAKLKNYRWSSARAYLRVNEVY